MRWNLSTVDEATVRTLGRHLGLSEAAACLLVQLGFHEVEAARAFLEAKLAQLEDPFRITNLQAAVRRLRRALAQDEEILVFGDYDVDGVTSTAFLVSILGRFGVHPRYIVPKRLEEGYGLSLDALERALATGSKPQLLIAVDCGTSSRSQVAWLRARGIDVIILDHHTSKEELPEDCILVNPHVNDPESAPWRELCTVGLIFKFVHGLLKDLRAEGDDLAQEIHLKEYLDLAALGTISDLVPLRGENRILAKNGLQWLKDTRRLGLEALFEVGGLKRDEDVTPFDVAFRLGPRINASGRLADATEPINLLLSHDRQQSLESARMLDGFNRERQEIEKVITETAEKQVESLGCSSEAALVLFDPAWHPGVVGIVASRISQKYHRPTLVLGLEGDWAKGSGRSVEGVSLVECLKSCADLLDKWGGHPMAVGVSLNPAHITALRERLTASVLEHTRGSMPEKSLRLARWVAASELNEHLLRDLERVGPFGQGNPEPIFGLARTPLRGVHCFGQGHFRFQVERGPGVTISGVAWKQADRLPPEGRPVDLAVRLAWNVWQGRRNPQLTLVDWRPTED